ncbi:unnamed protein product [Urochloa humidicola]
MEFDLLMNYSPEAQLELMNTMLQLEQLTALDCGQSLLAPSVSPPISPVQTHASHHCFSPPPHISTATAAANAAGYYPDQYTPPSPYAGGLDHLQTIDYYALSPDAAACALPPPQQKAAGSPSPTPSPTSSSPSAAADAMMREAMFHIAALQPVEAIDPEEVRPPKRRNVRISKDPQSVAARLRRERISERIRTLQRLVPGGTKMDTASMLDEAIHYVKFLKSQVQSLERAAAATATATHRAAALVGSAAYPALHAPWQYALPHGGM